MSKQVYKRYSEPFRIQVVREYEQGESLNALKQRYGVSRTTLRKWVAKYSLPGLRHQTMVIQTPEEQDQMKTLEERNRQLEQVVAQLSLDKLMLESTLAVVEREYNIDVKKNGLPSSMRPMNNGGQLR